MTIIGIVHIPSLLPIPTSTSSTNTSSHATVLQTHLSDLYPSQPPRPFHLDHRLYITTPSLLPKSESKRSFTHVFASSHTPQVTFIGTTNTTSSDVTNNTTPTSNPNPSLPTPITTTKIATISIPKSSTDTFLTLLSQKLQPQWAPRQSLTLENGTTTTIPIPDDATWTLGIGDLRASNTRSLSSGTTTTTTATSTTSSSIQSQPQPQSPAQNRGILIEIQYDDNDTSNPVLTSPSPSPSISPSISEYDPLFRNFLKALLSPTKIIDSKILEEIKISLLKINDNDDENESDKLSSENKIDDQARPVGSALAEMYMDILRGSRS